MRVNEIHISEKIREWKLAGKCVHSNCFLRFTEEEKMWKEPIVLVGKYG